MQIKIEILLNNFNLNVKIQFKLFNNVKFKTVRVKLDNIF